MLVVEVNEYEINYAVTAKRFYIIHKLDPCTVEYGAISNI